MGLEPKLTGAEESIYKHILNQDSTDRAKNFTKAGGSLDKLRGVAEKVLNDPSIEKGVKEKVFANLKEAMEGKRFYYKNTKMGRITSFLKNTPGISKFFGDSLKTTEDKMEGYSEMVKRSLDLDLTKNSDWTLKIKDMALAIMTGKATKEERLAYYDQMVDLGLKERALGNKDLVEKIDRALSLIDVMIFSSKEKTTEHRIKLLAKEENFEAFAAAHTGTPEELKKIIEDQTVQEKMKSMFKILSSDEKFDSKFEKFVKEYNNFSECIDKLTDRINDRDFKSGVLMALMAKDYKQWKGVIKKAESLIQKREEEIQAMEPSREKNRLLNEITANIPSSLVAFQESLGNLPTLVDFIPKDRWGREF